jgi:5-methylcytosine-specific restriction endonuclease McrA
MAYRKWYGENKEKRVEYHREWVAKNPEKVKATDKKRDLKGKRKEQKRIAILKWGKENPEKIREIQKKHGIKKRGTLKGNLSARMSNGIWRTLRGSKSRMHWELLVGYTIAQLTTRLLKTMPKGYTWQDYLNGKLHIDHIIPISAFNYQTPEDMDFKRCWALSNLRLLPAKENIQKRDRLQKPFQPAFAICGGN